MPSRHASEGWHLQQERATSCDPSLRWGDEKGNVLPAPLVMPAKAGISPGMM